MRFFKKLRLDDEYFHITEQDNLYLAIDHNSHPKVGETNQSLIFKTTKVERSFNLSLKTSQLDVEYFKGSKFLNQKYTSSSRFEQLRKLISFKQLLIAKQIEGSIDKLKSLSPNALEHEQKLLEWTRVSFEVLKKALSSIDHLNTLLQYKLFWGMIDETYTARLIIYNLDITYRFHKDSLEIVIIDGDKLVQKGIVKGHYNELFDHFITLLNEIKIIENKSFGL